MQKESTKYENVNPTQYSHTQYYYTLSWTAVITGALIATGLGFLLSLFDVGIGMSVVNNTNDGVQTVVIGSLIGLIIGTIITMFVAGWVAGLLSRHCCWNEHIGVLHGFVAWCLALIISLLLLSPYIDNVRIGTGALAGNTSNPIAQVIPDQRSSQYRNAPVDRSTPLNTEKTTNALGVSTLITFFLFFLGAVSACFGGYFGAGRIHHDARNKAAL